MIAPHSYNFLSSRLWRRASTAAALAGLLAFAGCKSTPPTTGADSSTVATTGADPAAANMAAGAVLGQSDAYQPQQQGETIPQQGAPAQTSGAPVADDYNANDYSYDQGTDPNAESTITADQAPPALPEYDQPPAPDPNYLWTPGYWGSGDNGYYWVPGVWCPPPYYGALWTPPYWGFYGGRYGFHHGYWGPHVGFYGGVDYGFGYVGIGFFGGYWHGNNFYYNRSVTNIGSVHNVYNTAVVVNNVHYGMQPSNRVSYNGGRGGLNVAPRPAELAAMHESHAGPVAAQTQLRQQAATNRGNFYAENHGRPAQAAFARPAGTPERIAEPPAAVRQTISARETQAFHPAAPAGRPGAPEPGRPAPEAARPGAPNEPQRNMPAEQRPGTPPQQQRPGFGQPQQQQHPEMPQHPGTPQPQARPEPQQQHPGAPQPQARPEVQQRPAPQPQRAAPAPQPRVEQAPRPAPAPAQRPAEAPRPAPAPAPRPAPAPAPRAAAPAPAPRPAPAPAGHEEHPR